MQSTLIGGLPSPVFFPSISSVAKNVWSIIDHIEFLVTIDHPQFLISCFDIYKYRNNKRLHKALQKARENNQIILLDSGLYEVVWKQSKKWTLKKYKNTLQNTNFSQAFCFDDYFLHKKNQKNKDNIINVILQSLSDFKDNTISPIIHCEDKTLFPEICTKISNSLKPELLAIPERELGHGILQIATNIKKIRATLNTLPHYQNIHILGTGNPLSILIYTLCGANSFDGLDWCQTVVDYKTATLHHKYHLDFYKHQSEEGNNQQLRFLTRCFHHNLEFYELWMNKLREITDYQSKINLIQDYITSPIKEQIIELLNED